MTCHAQVQVSIAHDLGARLRDLAASLGITLTATGAALGVLCALTTHLRRDADSVAFAWAGVLAAILWVVGIGCRMIFAFASDHGAGPAITRFSTTHSITSADAWVAALVMMALAEATARLVVLRMRGHKLLAATADAAQPATARAPA